MIFVPRRFAAVTCRCRLSVVAAPRRLVPEIVPMGVQIGCTFNGHHTRKIISKQPSSRPEPARMNRNGRPSTRPRHHRPGRGAGTFVISDLFAVEQAVPARLRPRSVIFAQSDCTSTATPGSEEATSKRDRLLSGRVCLPGVALGCQARIHDLTTSTSTDQPSPSGGGGSYETC